MRRSIFSKVDISKGETILLNHLSLHRPGTGLQPKDINKIINKKTKKKIRAGTLINFKMIS